MVIHMSLNEIGAKLKELRIKNNITQDELARNLYLSRQAVSRWETGKSIAGIHECDTGEESRD